MNKDIVQIEYRFLDLVVEGCYTEEEESTPYGNDLGGYPGSPAEFEIEKIHSLNDSSKQNLYDLFESAKWLKDLENKILDVI